MIVRLAVGYLNRSLPESLFPCETHWISTTEIVVLQHKFIELKSKQGIFYFVIYFQMAQKAGLMPNKDFFAEEKTADPTKKYNTYWDETSIDVQWLQRQKKSYRANLMKSIA